MYKIFCTRMSHLNNTYIDRPIKCMPSIGINQLGINPILNKHFCKL